MAEMARDARQRRHGQFAFSPAKLQLEASGCRSSPARCYTVGLKLAGYSVAMKPEFPIVRASKPTLDTRDLPNVPALARSADAKETAIVCLSAALLFASLAVLALATER